MEDRAEQNEIIQAQLKRADAVIPPTVSAPSPAETPESRYTEEDEDFILRAIQDIAADLRNGKEIIRETILKYPDLVLGKMNPVEERQEIYVGSLVLIEGPAYKRKKRVGLHAITRTKSGKLIAIPVAHYINGKLVPLEENEGGGGALLPWGERIDLHKDGKRRKRHIFDVRKSGDNIMIEPKKALKDSGYTLKVFDPAGEAERSKEKKDTSTLDNALDEVTIDPEEAVDKIATQVKEGVRVVKVDMPSGEDEIVKEIKPLHLLDTVSEKYDTAPPAEVVDDITAEVEAAGGPGEEENIPDITPAGGAEGPRGAPDPEFKEMLAGISTLDDDMPVHLSPKMQAIIAEGEEEAVEKIRAARSQDQVVKSTVSSLGAVKEKLSIFGAEKSETNLMALLAAYSSFFRNYAILPTDIQENKAIFDAYTEYRETLMETMNLG